MLINPENSRRRLIFIPLFNAKRIFAENNFRKIAFRKSNLGNWILRFNIQSVIYLITVCSDWKQVEEDEQ